MEQKLSLSYKRDEIKGDYDVIIIGSGLGGMVTGSILAKEGKKVLVLERHYTGGGYTHVFKRRGYEWDVGVHYIGEMHKDTMLKKIFDYCTDDDPIEWADMGEVYDKLFFGDEEFNYVKGTQNFVEQMKKYFPAQEDQDAIDEYISLVYSTQKKQTMYFAEKVIPGAMRWIFGSALRKSALKLNKSTKEVLEGITTNKKLIAVLTGQFGDYGLPPSKSSFLMHCMLTKHYFNGGFYPVGGSSVIYDKIAPSIINRGGNIYTNAEVDEIIIKNNKAIGVKMEDGKEIFAKWIVSSAGAVNTYSKLIPQSVLKAKKMDKLLDNVTPSIGHLCLYMGFNHSTEELKLQKSNYWIYPDRFDHDKNIEEFLEDQESELPVVYVSFPSAKDPDWDRRYPGKATIDIITLADYDWYKKWEDARWMKRGDEYNALKEKMAQRMMEKLFHYEPQLRGKVDYYELSTPLSTKHFVNYQTGELYGLEASPERFNQKFLRPRTPIKNLFLTGQDTVSVGVGGAVASGLLTASNMMKRNLTGRMNKK